MDTPVPLQFPYTFFKTQKWMDDYGARDMRYGDLSETQLKRDYGLERVAVFVDPYTLTEVSRSDLTKAYNSGIPIPGLDVPGLSLPGSGLLSLALASSVRVKITHQQCVAKLFDEFRFQAKLVSFQGPYQLLIEQLITHMQRNYGAPFRSMLLDRALEEQILNDWTNNSSRLQIKKALSLNIDWVNKIYPEERKGMLRKAILDGKLPKFDRLQDHINGMAVSVHDTWATYITLQSLDIVGDRFRAVVHYKVQDHFGLDDEDILKVKFNLIPMFRTWFVLQRYNKFGFRPFMTNMEATIEITGGPNEK